MQKQGRLVIKSLSSLHTENHHQFKILILPHQDPINRKVVNDYSQLFGISEETGRTWSCWSQHEIFSIHSSHEEQATSWPQVLYENKVKIQSRRRPDDPQSLLCHAMSSLLPVPAALVPGPECSSNSMFKFPWVENSKDSWSLSETKFLLIAILMVTCSSETIPLPVPASHQQEMRDSPSNLKCDHP